MNNNFKEGKSIDTYPEFYEYIERKYIPLINAVALFERYKIEHMSDQIDDKGEWVDGEYVRQLVKCTIKDDPYSNRLPADVFLSINGKTNHEISPLFNFRLASFLDLIKSNIIKLYGKNEKHEIVQIEEKIISLLGLQRCSVITADWHEGKYEIYSVYDYNSIYEDNINYSSLRYIPTGEIKYNELSIDWNELGSLIKEKPQITIKI